MSLAPQQNETPPASESALPTKQSSGPIFGTIIVVIILILGGLYFAMTKFSAERNTQMQLPYIQSGTTTITVTK